MNSLILQDALSVPARDDANGEPAAQALRRAALAVAQLGNADLFDDIVRQLAEDLQASVAFIAIFEGPDRLRMSTLAARMDGGPLPNFSYLLEGTVCAQVVGRAFRYIPVGATTEFPGGVMDSYAAYPLNASDDTPLGIIVAMDRAPIADPDLAESLMKIFAVRVAAELERRRGIEALRRSEASYRAIFEAVEDAVFVHDWDTGAVLDLNPRATEAYGYSREEMIGWTIDRFGMDEAPYTAEAALGWVNRAKQGECPLFTWRRRRSDGTLWWDEVRLKAVTINGRPYVLACTRDITARKAAEDALRSREAQYRAMFDGSADALVLWDRNICIVDANAAFTRMYGYKPEEVIGRSFDHRFSPEEVARRSNLIKQALGGEQAHLETRTIRKDGSQMDVELRYLPIMHRGEPHVLAVARDITSRREDEARRLELEDQIRQAQKMEAIGQLTGGIAHDFNNILTSVIGYVAMAEERATVYGDPHLIRQLDQAHLASRRARDLIAQMLTFARRQRGERRPTALPALVRQSVQLLRATMPSTTIIDVDVPEPLPSAMVDGVQIEQVLFNLCINARDAVKSNGRIRVRLQDTTCDEWRCASCRAEVPPGRWLELSVADNGCGIVEEIMGRIFDPFYSTKEMGRGSGMGLSMVHGIVHDHGGHLLVETTPGKGTIFRVMLPPSGEAQPGQAPTPSPRVGVAAVPLLRGRVVVVEDQAMVGDFMAELLGNWGLEVAVLRDPLLALEWLKDSSHYADLVITDQTMPGMTGLELAAHMAEERPGIPVVLYTGDAAEFTAAELARCGVRTLVRKPLDPRGLRSALEVLLEAGSDD